MQAILLFIMAVLLTACHSEPANYPHGQHKSSANIYFSSFTQQPKTFDPAVSYSADEAIFVAQVVEPPLQYHYLKRPYQLIPLTAARMPEKYYLDKNFHPLSVNTLPNIIPLSQLAAGRQKQGASERRTGAYTRVCRVCEDGLTPSWRSGLRPATNVASKFDNPVNLLSTEATPLLAPLVEFRKRSNIAYTVYRITIQPHIYYQPHPAFAKTADGQLRYLNLSSKALKKYHTLKDFPQSGTRELTADDYVYEIKRLASPQINSPIQGLMSQYILGFNDFNRALQPFATTKKFIDLRQFPLTGAKVINRYTYEITIKGIFEQFPYWLATPFFGPVPWEADELYSRAVLQNNNINFTTYPVGTGAYMITENNPNSEIILKRNPHFHREFYPAEGEASDKAQGYLKNAGQRLPFVDAFIFNLEKESIPRWNKFLQGYYDASTIGADNFDQAVEMNSEGRPIISPELAKKGIRLKTTILPSIYYFGFNMHDPVVGGYSDAQRKLRHAIALAVDTQQYIAIFLNGRGQVAYSPIPPGIFGFEQQKINPAIAGLSKDNTHLKSLAYAKELLAEAGYPNGINAKTGKPLILRYDAVSGLGADERAQYQWLQGQFAQLGIQLIINDTDYNRFQDKARSGNLQIFFWGWGADYPDPENFLFTLYGPNSQMISGGENSSNYANSEFDALFQEMKNLPNTAQRKVIIDKMTAIFQQDMPWFSIFYGESYQLTQSWVIPTKVNGMANNTLKYLRLNPEQRVVLQKKWNHAYYGYLLMVLFVIFMSFIPFFIKYRMMQRAKPKRI